MVHTQTQREEIFKSDLELIKGYLAKRFKTQLSDIHFKRTLNNELVVLADEKEVKKVLGEGEIEELNLFNDKMWQKLKMFSIRNFKVHKGKIIAVIEYKVNIKIVTLSSTPY